MLIFPLFFSFVISFCHFLLPFPSVIPFCHFLLFFPPLFSTSSFSPPHPIFLSCTTHTPPPCSLQGFCYDADHELPCFFFEDESSCAAASPRCVFKEKMCLSKAEANACSSQFEETTCKSPCTFHKDSHICFPSGLSIPCKCVTCERGWGGEGSSVECNLRQTLLGFSLRHRECVSECVCE